MGTIIEPSLPAVVKHEVMQVKCLPQGKSLHEQHSSSSLLKRIIEMVPTWATLVGSDLSGGDSICSLLSCFQEYPCNHRSIERGTLGPPDEVMA